MSFKLAYRSMRKNMKDYIIYFLTLIFGVAIFYVFNSMDSQQAMMRMSESKTQILGLMTQVLGGVSIFVSFVLGFLIVYANNFLIKRRKKEFGLYMLLGMGKKKISKMLLIETILIGIFSLAVGLVIGIFASQLMSVLVSQLFEATMKEYQFIFSIEACIKTVIYFAIIYFFVMFINMITTSRYKLIDLMTAKNKNEKVKIKNPIISVILFIVSVIILGVAYYMAIFGVEDATANRLLIAVGLGCVGTFLFFYSLSGFILKLIQSNKKLYQKGLNMFVLRQVDSKINTTTISMSVISILLFLTICIFSSAMSLNNMMTVELKTYNPVDATFTRSTNVRIDDKTYSYAEALEKRFDRNELQSTEALLQEAGLDTKNVFRETLQTYSYVTSDLKFEDTLSPVIGRIKAEYPMLQTNMSENMMKVSEYNQIAKMFGTEQVSIADDEFVIIANYEQMTNIRNEALQKGVTINLDGKEYHSKYDTCVNGFTSNAAQAMETGVIIVPDNAVKEEWKAQEYFIVNYTGNTEEEKQQVEEQIAGLMNVGKNQNVSQLKNITGLTKISIYDSSKGLGATATFIGLYLGIIFLISSSAILALKELSDSSDNVERYNILRKIGTDEKMINRALFKQIGIFYIIPLLLAIVHSVFGLIVADKVLSAIGKQNVMGSIIVTAIFMTFVYGIYFIATYIGSKNIIKEKR